MRAAMAKLSAGGAPLGQLLRNLRRSEGWLGLGLTAFCPPEIVLGNIDTDGDVGTRRAPGKLPKQPFSPLASLDSEQRPLLAGRDRAVFGFASLLDEPDSGLVLLHGAASVGKSSFLRAGVIPYLEEDCIGFRALRDRTAPDGAVPSEQECPIVSVRASRDLTGQLAEALCAFCDQPYPYISPTQEVLTVPLPNLLRQAVNGRASPRAASQTAIQKGPTISATNPAGITEPPTEMANWAPLQER